MESSENDRRHFEGRSAFPDSVWAAAREDYLSGLSGAQVCARHGMALSSLRKRAARENWRRADQPWPELYDEGDELEASVDGELDRVGPADLSYVAHRRMMRAVLRGSATEALRWKRVQIMLDAEQAEADEWTKADEEQVANARREAERAKTAANLEKMMADIGKVERALAKSFHQPAERQTDRPAGETSSPPRSVDSVDSVHCFSAVAPVSSPSAPDRPDSRPPVA